jgi:hypothetical protein
MLQKGAWWLTSTATFRLGGSYKDHQKPVETTTVLVCMCDDERGSLPISTPRNSMSHVGIFVQAARLRRQCILSAVALNLGAKEYRP